MKTLTIDYVLEGRKRGYSFTTPTDGVNPDALKTLWRHAMPRGAGWGDDALIGAASLKCFLLDTGEAALCDVTVTDQRDEVGRKGIRRAAIRIMPPKQLQQTLLERLAALPDAITAEAERRLYSREWALLFKKYRNANKPQTIVKPQTILAYPYTTREAWQFVEACMLILATRSTLLTNLIEVSPAINPFADRVLAFNTLALDYRNEARLVALPLATVEKFANADGVPYINLS